MRAERAAVRPLVYVDGIDGAVTIDLIADRWRDLRPEQAVELRARPGWGGTTILRHLAALLDGTGIVFLDKPDHAELMNELRDRPVIFTAIPRAQEMPQIVSVLVPAPWGMDQVVEYLLARHRARIRGVMDAVMADLEFETLEGVPELVVAVLDHMAIAPPDHAPRIGEAIDHLLDAARRAVKHPRYLEALCGPMLMGAGPSPVLPRLTLIGPARLLQHRALHLRLALDQIRTALADPRASPIVPKLSEQRLVSQCVELAKRDEVFATNIRRAIDTLPSAKVAPAISILHAAGRPWLADEGPLPHLSGARLPNWRPTRKDLSGLDAHGADLHLADLKGTVLECADLSKSNLVRALAIGARLSRANLEGCRLAGADFSDVIANGANFDETDSSAARFDRASAVDSSWYGSTLTGARFVRTQLQKAKICRAMVEYADFSGANLTFADLQNLDLRMTQLAGAYMAHAVFTACRLEGLQLIAPNLENARFEGCDLTGASMPNAALRLAKLHRCGLMDIEWEGADLRSVDFRKSTFHAGSSRSGLVSAGHILPASEGSRTGFYTDDTGDWTHKAPEDIRKANLCGADLRGAIISRVDFYLVDLRHARYTPDQAEWFRKCGAILGNR